MTDTMTQSTDTWTGSFAHTELGSNDPAATKAFLTNVFDLQFDTLDTPMGDYHMAYVPGRPSCAVRAVMTQQEPGPSQTPFVNVDNMDTTVKAATAAGATILLPKTAVPGQGWMAWMTIPGGNTIAAWQQDENAA